MDRPIPFQRRRPSEPRGSLVHILVTCPECEGRVRLIAGRRGSGPGATGECPTCRVELVLTRGDLTPVDLSA